MLLTLKQDNFEVSVTGGGITPPILPNFPGYPNAEVGALQNQDGTKKYIVVANRNCTSSSNISISSQAYNDRMLKDIETGIEYPMNTPINFAPSDGKIFEVVINSQEIPTVPTGLSLIKKNDSSVVFEWQPSVDNASVAGYYVYCNDTYVAEVSQPFFSHACLDPETTLYYRVYAYDDQDNISSPSLPLIVNTSYAGDLNGDSTLDTDDIFIFIQNWLDPGICTAGNFDGIEGVNMHDYSLLLEYIKTFEEQGTGLYGDYYDSANFNSYVFSRVDSSVDFVWNTDSPAQPMQPDTFSVRWTGYVYAPISSSSYWFYTNSDDGVRLWVNNQLIINNWTDHATEEDSGRVFLSGGVMYPIKIEYYENGGDAVIQLLWSYPGQDKTIVPSKFLYPN